MREILKHLRAAAQPKTVLVILDNIMPYAAPSSNLHADIPGAATPPVPPPLLPNLGIVSAVPTGSDMQVCCNSAALLCSDIDESRCR
jgi:hypothetical protein